MGMNITPAAVKARAPRVWSPLLLPGESEATLFVTSARRDDRAGVHADTLTLRQSDDGRCAWVETRHSLQALAVDPQTGTFGFTRDDDDGARCLFGTVANTHIELTVSTQKRVPVNGRPTLLNHETTLSGRGPAPGYDAEGRRHRAFFVAYCAGGRTQRCRDDSLARGLLHLGKPVGPVHREGPGYVQAFESPHGQSFLLQRDGQRVIALLPPLARAWCEAGGVANVGYPTGEVRVSSGVSTVICERGTIAMPETPK